MRLIARFSKKEEARFVSHLDVQRLFGRAFRRANTPVCYSQGFNPHPVLAFATALATGVTSDAEWLDVKLARDMECEEFVESLNAALPSGIRVLEAFSVDEKLPALTALLSAAAYTVRFLGDVDTQKLEEVLVSLMAGLIVVDKRTKGGIKPVDIRPQVHAAKFGLADENIPALYIKGQLDASGSLNPDVFTKELLARAGTDMDYKINRSTVFFTGGSETPLL